MSQLPIEILAADIGGTNSRFGIFSFGKSDPIYQISLKTQDFSSFYELLVAFKKSQPSISFEQIKSAVFAVAGPIVDVNKINPPNISWNIALADVSGALGIENASLINDFQAQALAILSAEEKNKIEIFKGKSKDTHPRAVIGAGTGFGKSLLIRAESGKYQSIASEGGHNDFSATSDQEFAFRKFAMERRNLTQFTWDDVLSGRGLEILHEFISSEKLSAVEISSRYLGSESKTLEMFSRFYARAARSFVLETMALGGLYIAGGVAAKNSLIVQSKFFKESFFASIYKEILQEVPVYLLTSEDSGLRGAAYEAFRLSS